MLESMELTFLGTGTSHGIPVIGCDCAVCTSTDKRDRRYRSSVLITETDGTSVVIDTGPEFRLQAVENHIKHLDALFFTHSHADHMNGMDDVRIFSCTGRASVNPEDEKPPLPIYGAAGTLRDLKHRFDYVFKDTQKAGGKPKIELHDIVSFPESTVRVGQLSFTEVPLLHGSLNDSGWLIRDVAGHSIAYLTDVSELPESSIALVRNADVLVIDGLRRRKHPTHFSFSEAVAATARIAPGKAYITHICHDLKHDEINKILAEEKAEYPSLTGVSVQAAFDSLRIPFFNI